MTMSLPLSPQDAARELLRRRSIRRSLTEYARLMGFEPAAHHRLIIQGLEDIAFGVIDNLLIFAPPGSAKSTYVSHLFPSWYMAVHPSHNVLAATHSVEFAERWGRKVRGDVRDNSLILGIEPDQSNQAAARWALTSGGEYYGVGAGVGISGFRADLGLIDDPFGSREDAWSETVRSKRWDWYIDDFSARLKPSATRAASGASSLVMIAASVLIAVSVCARAKDRISAVAFAIYANPGIIPSPKRKTPLVAGCEMVP